MCREEANEIKRGREARGKLREILKAKTFSKFLKYTRHMVNAKQKLFLVMKKHDLAVKDESTK